MADSVNGAEQEQGAAEPKRSTHRSPNFPALPLAEAVVKARTVFDKDRRNPTTAAVVLSHLGYGKTLSGSAGRVLSALRQYGLLEEVGDKLRVSDTAFHIITLSDKAPERLAAIRLAAERPATFREVLKQYADGLPSDPTLSDWLIAKKGFNPASVQGFIRSFKATIQFAGMEPDRYNGPDDVPDTPDEQEPALEQMSKHEPTAATLVLPTTTPKKQVGVSREVFALGDGEVALEWPDNLDPDALQDVEDWLKLIVRKLKRLKAKPSG